MPIQFYLRRFNKRIGLPSPHRSPLWQVLPYFIPEHSFFTLLYAIETFTQIYVHNTMYLQGFVRLPIPVTSRVRQSIYQFSFQVCRGLFLD